LQRHGAERPYAALTQINPILTLGLFNHALALGNFLGIVLGQMRNEDEMLSSAAVDEHPGGEIRPVSPAPIARALKGGIDKPVGKFQDLRAVVMTIRNKRAQAAVPHQVTRNLSCLAWFSSPRGITCKTRIRRETKHTWRISHGNARSFENLRGLRLPLVPATNAGKHLLQGLPDEATRVSTAGGPLKTWETCAAAFSDNLGSC
jgi:hypothetical protein